MFERAAWLWLLLALPLVAWPAYTVIRDGRGLVGTLSATVRILCFTAIVMTLAGAQIPWRGNADHVELMVAMDQSRSITTDQRAWMMRQVAQIRRAMSERDRIALIGFGRDAHLIAAPSSPRMLSLTPLEADPGATDIAGAMATAGGVFDTDDGAEKRLLILTDGNETRGDALAEARELSVEDVRIFTETPPPPVQPRVAISSFEAPNTVRADTSFEFRFDVDSEAPDPQSALVQLYADDKPVGASQITLNSGMNYLRLPYRVGKPGAYLMKVAIAVPPPTMTLNPEAEAPLTVTKPPKVLIISGGALDSLSGLLKMRGFEVATTAPRGLPTNPVDYLAYQAVIITNTPAEALDDAVQQALNSYVADFGGGLVVVGDSLRDSHFHDGALEKVLPVDFVPQPPPPSREPIAVYLLIDRSNSMSYDSREPAVRDGERIRYAKQAAVALLNQLDDTDYAGVIAFDSEPYVLGHLQPLARDRAQLLAQVERLEPGGGTDFKEALGIAKREILASGIAVRQVILLTDGDTNRQYHDHDELMQEFAHEGVPVSTIRIGPDLENLRLLQDFASATGGTFYRVEDITKLPQLLVHLTHEAQNLRLRKHTSVEAAASSSILDGINPHQIPPVDFFAVTKAKDGASVPLIAHRGAQSAPLLADWQYALGRTAIVSADPDSIGSLAWLKWDHYAEFWSQLVNWVAREGSSGPFNLRVRTETDGVLKIEAEGAGQPAIANLFCRVTNGNQATDIELNQISPSLYRGDAAPFPRGKYKLALMIKTGDTERLLLQRNFASVGRVSSDAAELELKPSNLSLLREIARATGGRYQPTLDDLLQQSGNKVPIWIPIGRIMPTVAVLLLLGDVLIRRRFLDA